MKQRDFLFIAIFTFVTVLAWIIFTIYHTRVTSIIEPTLKEKIEPIEPRFDTQTIDVLKKQRKPVNLLPETVASPSPTIQPTKEATPGGRL